MAIENGSDDRSNVENMRALIERQIDDLKKVINGEKPSKYFNYVESVPDNRKGKSLSHQERLANLEAVLAELQNPKE